MKKNAKKLNALFVCAAELIIGILLLISPVAFTRGVVIVFGILLMARGLWMVISYFRTPAQEAVLKQSLAAGLSLLLLGALCALGHAWLMAAVPFLGMLYAVLLLALGIQKVQTAVDQYRLGYRRWYVAGISALLSLIASVVIFCNPFSAAEALWIFAGVALIAQAVGDIAAYILNHIKG